jgi:hypothetical protein
MSHIDPPDRTPVVRTMIFLPLAVVISSLSNFSITASIHFCLVTEDEIMTRTEPGRTSSIFSMGGA